MVVTIQAEKKQLKKKGKKKTDSQLGPKSKHHAEKSNKVAHFKLKCHIYIKYFKLKSDFESVPRKKDTLKKNILGLFSPCIAGSMAHNL